MPQVQIWNRGRQYFGIAKQPISDCFKETECLVKAGLGDYIVIETYDDKSMADSILFAWGRIMWHSSQIDLTQSEIEAIRGQST